MEKISDNSRTTEMTHPLGPLKNVCSSIILAEFLLDIGSAVIAQVPHPIVIPQPTLAALMIPEGSHLRAIDYCVFRVPSNDIYTNDAIAFNHCAVPPEVGYSNNDNEDQSGFPAIEAFGKNDNICFNIVWTRKDVSSRRGSRAIALGMVFTSRTYWAFRSLLLAGLHAIFAAPAASYTKILERLLLSANTASEKVTSTFGNLSLSSQIAFWQHVINPASNIYVPKRISFEFSLESIAEMTSPPNISVTNEGEVGGIEEADEYIGLSTQFFAQISSSPFPNQTSEASIAWLTSVFGAQGVVSIYNAILLRKRILFVGHQQSSRACALAVVSACALICPNPLLSLDDMVSQTPSLGLETPWILPISNPLRRSFPYASLYNTDFLKSNGCGADGTSNGSLGGYIAGVTNPLFETKTEWWDLCCNLTTRTVSYSPTFHSWQQHTVAQILEGDLALGLPDSNSSDFLSSKDKSHKTSTFSPWYLNASTFLSPSLSSQEKLSRMKAEESNSRGKKTSPSLSQTSPFSTFFSGDNALVNALATLHQSFEATRSAAPFQSEMDVSNTGLSQILQRSAALPYLVPFSGYTITDGFSSLSSSSPPSTDNASTPTVSQFSLHYHINSTGISSTVNTTGDETFVGTEILSPLVSPPAIPSNIEYSYRLLFSNHLNQLISLLLGPMPLYSSDISDSFFEPDVVDEKTHIGNGIIGTSKVSKIAKPLVFLPYDEFTRRTMIFSQPHRIIGLLSDPIFLSQRSYYWKTSLSKLSFTDGDDGAAHKQPNKSHFSAFGFLRGINVGLAISILRTQTFPSSLVVRRDRTLQSLQSISNLSGLDTAAEAPLHALQTLHKLASHIVQDIQFDVNVYDDQAPLERKKLAIRDLNVLACYFLTFFPAVDASLNTFFSGLLSLDQFIRTRLQDLLRMILQSSVVKNIVISGVNPFFRQLIMKR